MHLCRILCDRWHSAWREVSAATIAALFAWVVAQRLFGHPVPGVRDVTADLRRAEVTWALALSDDPTAT